ncbi:MAG: MBL fold metallo-hydrolase [Clostridiales bacterium]|nr:MBL fold metallo-hydrolase [Clostridiales bacterium]
MKLIPLASSSAGNAYLAEDGTTTLLLECGLPWKRLCRLMGAVGVTPDRLSGCLITHEHGDHAKGWQDVEKSGIPLCCTEGTAAALGMEHYQELPIDPRQRVGTAVTVGTVEALAFRTDHDAREPAGFLLRSRADGEKLVFATDTATLRYRFHGVAIYALEANYDRDTLETGNAPERVQERIRRSHMEIGNLCAFLSRQDLTGCREIWLLHLSDSGSSEGYFVERVRQTVGPGITVQAAPKAADGKGGKKHG